MPENVEAILQEYQPSDYSVRLVQAICAAVPGVPAFTHPSTIGHVLKATVAAPQPAMLGVARAHLGDDDLQDAMWMASVLDKADKAYGAYTGVKSALSFVFGDRSKALELDDEQRNDAVLKALALSYIVWKAFPGGPAEKVSAFQSSNAGKTLLTYYGAAELALPFADNVLQGGGGFVSGMLRQGTAAQASRLSALAGGRSVEEARGVLTQLTGTLESTATAAAKHAGAIAESVKKHLPNVMSGADKATGLLATGVDVLPVYRMLVAGLVAEQAVRRGAGSAVA